MEALLDRLLTVFGLEVKNKIRCEVFEVNHITNHN